MGAGMREVSGSCAVWGGCPGNPARPPQIQVCSCAAHGGGLGDRLTEVLLPASAWCQGFPLPPPRRTQGSCFFPKNGVWWLQIPSDGHCWEVSERAWVADVTLVWGPGALETATGVTQQHREPGCFGRGGLYSSAPQMGLFPSPQQPSEPPAWLQWQVGPCPGLGAQQDMALLCPPS